ncbi:metallophosphoesterase family protein [Pedobacter rhizosphaerae]|uniref:3',5'-cyclic AMP phosphodiesterase CpdA n=1 Tax=Pedobacter rhizosphaerae TaxID=390241 RepID=A0A1H9VKB4_9SPHI|nr:metallophosphoesterase [Pedobacter rhizosphaerae]SES22024.1 3',5'-cyclic AMP phosphodiesterase CpdA [Pedobacter rhizosphaerae]
MSNRRFFIKSSLASFVLAGLNPVVPAIAENLGDELPAKNKPVKLRFAIASDGHYGQPKTDYKKDHENIVRWLNESHDHNPLDFVIINGDLVHDRPELLPEVKKNYFDRLKVPFYAIPGNHDHADATIWKNVFGYEDNFAFQKNGVGFVLANTSDTKGVYRCPDNNFLKQELDKFKDLKTVFVVLHIPPHFWVPESPFVECPDTIELLHRYPNIKAVFHGHDHSLDAVFYTNKLPHFFDAHFGGNWGTAYKGYRIVEVNEDSTISTHQVNASQTPVLNETTF